MAVLSTLRGDFVRDFKLIWHEGYQTFEKHICVDEADYPYLVKAMIACATEDTVYFFDECLIHKDCFGVKPEFNRPTVSNSFINLTFTSYDVCSI